VSERSRVRIEWVGADEIPEVLRQCAEAEVQSLGSTCQQMRAMSIERTEGGGEPQCRLRCGCRDRQRCVRVTRMSLGEALLAFGRTLRARCIR
jgi:hypothetical protein